MATRHATRCAADPAADHVEPADRRRRGAGADHDPHRVLHHGARGGRPVRRHLRPARPHDGAGGHRHAGPRQLDGGKRRAFPARNSRPTTMREGDHYITNDPWLGTGHLHDLTVVTPGFPQRPHRRAVRQHRACHRHRRPRHGARRALGVRGRPVHPDRQMLRPGPAERDVLRLHPRRLAPAGGAGGRHLFAVRLQRRRRAPAGAR